MDFNKSQGIKKNRGLKRKHGIKNNTKIYKIQIFFSILSIRFCRFRLNQSDRKVRKTKIYKIQINFPFIIPILMFPAQFNFLNETKNYR